MIIAIVLLYLLFALGLEYSSELHAFVSKTASKLFTKKSSALNAHSI